MKITKVEAIELRLPEEEIMYAPTGTNDTLIIKIHTDEGIVGIGEVESSPRMAKAVIEAPYSNSVTSGLSRLLIGMNPLDIEVINEKLYQETFYVGRRGLVLHAIGGVDIALWDIAGKYYNQPVYRLLGGAFHEKIRVYASNLFQPTPELTYERAKWCREQGFTAAKFGWCGFGENEAKDVALIEAIRRGMGEDASIMVDVGCAWDVKTAKQRARAFEPYHLKWIEEPLAQDNVEGYGELSKASSVPIAAGEGEAGVFAYRDLIERGNVDVVQVDLSKNGITTAQKVATMAELHHKHVCNHFYSTPIDLAASVQWIAAQKNADILEYCMEDTTIRNDLIMESFEPVDGYIQVPDRPGLGITLNEDVVEKYRVEERQK